MKGHITKRGKNSWSLVIDLGRDTNGKRKQKWHTVTGKKSEAQKELRRLLTELEEGTYIEPTKLTTGEFLERWLKQVKPLIATKTYIRYEEICRLHLIPALGHHLLTKLNGIHIEDHYAEARESGRINGEGGLSERTLLHHHRVLFEAMKRAVKLKLRSRNPVEDVESPRPVSKEVQALDEEQTVALLKVAEGTPLYMPILFAVTTGLRRGELVGLKWKDIDLETSGVTVSRSIQQTKGKVEIKKPKTESSKRTVTIPSIAMEALQTHRIEQNKQRLKLGKIYQNEDWVFAKPDGSLWKPDSLTQAFRKLISDSGLPKVRFHDLRHSHASQLLKKGVHPKVAQERLGHSSIAITLDLYSHLLKGVQEEAASKVDEALRSAIKKPSS